MNISGPWLVMGTNEIRDSFERKARGPIKNWCVLGLLWTFWCRHLWSPLHREGGGASLMIWTDFTTTTAKKNMGSGSFHSTKRMTFSEGLALALQIHDGLANPC